MCSCLVVIAYFRLKWRDWKWWLVAAPEWSCWQETHTTCKHCVFELVWVWTPWCSRHISLCVGTPQRAVWIVHQGSPPPIALMRSWWPCWTVWGEEVSTASLVTPYPNSHFPTSWQSWPQWTRWVLTHVTGGQLFHITETCSVSQAGLSSHKSTF